MSLSLLLNGHRSIRKYKPNPIDPLLIQSVCSDAVAGASSSGNLNCVTMVLTQDPERKQKLYDFHFEQPFILEAPLLITFCADWYRTREWLRQRNARDNFDNLIGYHVALVDASILSQNVALGFEALGLGICYMGTTLFSIRKISEFLELPETCVPVTTITVGYPDEDPKKRDRLPIEALVHEERYRMPAEADIDATYEQREVKGWERYMAYPELRQLAEERGITKLAQFYTSEIKYDPDRFREMSEELREFMEEKRFIP